MDARSQTGQLATDRSNFWKVVDRTNPSKLYLFSENELRDCQDYFAKMQSDPTVPPNELIMAAERLTMIRSEIDGRRGAASYRRAQRLARWAIGIAMISLSSAIAFGIALFLPRQAIRENWSVDPETSTVSAAMTGEIPAPTPEFAPQPSPTPDAVLAPVYAIAAPTTTPTPNRQSRAKHRARRTRKINSTLQPQGFFQSLFQPRPTQTPSTIRRR